MALVGRFPRSIHLLLVLSTGLPVLAAFLIYLPFVLGFRLSHIVLFLVQWGLDTCLLAWLFTRMFRSAGYAVASALSTLLAATLAICAMSFQEVLRPSILFAHYSSSLDLPLGTLWLYLPYALVPVALCVGGLVYLLPRPGLAFASRPLCGLVTAKVGLLSAILLWAPSYHESGASQASLIRRYGVLGFYLLDGVALAEASNKPDVRSLCQENLRNHPLPSLSSPLRSRRVLVIQVESLDLGILFAELQGREITPFLNRLAKEAGYYPLETNHDAVAGSIGTDFQFLTGFRITGPHPPFWYDLTPLAEESLVGYCRQRQIPFTFFHGNAPDYYRRNLAMRELGLGTWYSAYNVPRLTASRWGVSDQDMVHFLLEKTRRERPKAFLDYWVTLSSHAPFDLVDHSFFSGRSLEARVANSFHYTDAQVQRLIEDWPVPETLMILYGDHPAPLPDHHDQVVPLMLFVKGSSGIQPVATSFLKDQRIEVANLNRLIKEVMN